MPARICCAWAAPWLTKATPFTSGATSWASSCGKTSCLPTWITRSTIRRFTIALSPRLAQQLRRFARASSGRHLLRQQRDRAAGRDAGHAARAMEPIAGLPWNCRSFARQFIPAPAMSPRRPLVACCRSTREAASRITTVSGLSAHSRGLAPADVKFTSECLAFAHVPEPATCFEIMHGAAAAMHHPRWKAPRATRCRQWLGLRRCARSLSGAALRRRSGSTAFVRYAALSQARPCRSRRDDGPGICRMAQQSFAQLGRIGMVLQRTSGPRPVGVSSIRTATRKPPTTRSNALGNRGKWL